MSIKRTFGQEDRARLRGALIGYMKEHDIGVPALQLRIAKATGREPHLLPLKTLQRFLADTTCTNDALLSLCYQFAESVTPKPGTQALSEAAAAFFDTPKGGEERDGLIGRWSGAAPGNKTGISVVRGPTREDVSSVATSELTIEVNNAALRITEKVTNPAANRTAKYDPGFQHTYEGIALQFSPLLCIVSKNMLTRLPRTYWLQLNDAGLLEGHGAEAIFEAGPTRVVSDLSAFKFERAAGEA